MKLQNNLFDLSNDEIKTSQLMYNKVIKCLIAPYHTAKNIEIEYASNIFMFPEKELSQFQTKQFISMVVNSPLKEVLIITADLNIILDMVDDCVRILTERDEIIRSPEKTFAANPHTIIYNILNNDAHKISKSERTKYQNDINNVIKKINDSKTITKQEKDEYLSIIDKIGERIIMVKLKDMINEKLER